MNLSYRTRRNLRVLGKTLVILFLIAAISWLCWIIWVGRFIYFDRDLGAKLDFSLEADFPEGTLAVPPTVDTGVNIIYNDPQVEKPPEVQEKTGIAGYYIDLSDLQDDIPAVIEQLKALRPGTAVMLDVKSPKGYFFYSSDLEEASDSTLLDVAQMDTLFTYLASSDLYAIARLPAFRDWRYGLNNVPSGLPEQNKGGALWMDDTGCYWLDPTDQQALSYLVRITKELQSLGFDEVVFDDFRFPYTNQIVFSGDKTQAIADAAATLATACATEQFCVSFMSRDASFLLPDGNCRVYLQNVAAEDADTVAQQVQTTEPELHVLFMTTTNDTRFDKYSVLRPLDSAH